MKTTAQKRKEAREARASDPYAYQRSLERRTKKAPPRPAPMYTRHGPKVIEEHRARLYHHVSMYPEYLDRDRDVLLLAIFDMLEGLKPRP